MSTFSRKGHWRTRLGDTHWVSGSIVKRAEWGKSSWIDLTLEQRSEWLIEFIKAHSFELTKSLLVPNAKCPECDEAVYFFRHHNGGCAWFDDIPAPWPKHGCMGIDGTKCSSDYIAECDEVLKKEEEAKRRFDYAKERIRILQSKPFAERFFNPSKCEICDRDEYEFELSDSTVRRFTDIGSTWIKSDCTLKNNGQHERANNAEYLDDFLQTGGKWKTSVPSRIFRLGQYYGVEDNIGIYLSTGENIFRHGLQSNHFVIPANIVEGRGFGDNYMLVVLESLVFPEHQILVQTQISRNLEHAKLVFLHGTMNEPNDLHLSYLCLETGSPQKTGSRLLAYLNVGERVSRWEGVSYNIEALDILFERHSILAEPSET